MLLSATEQSLLRAAAMCGETQPDGCCKCDRVLRHVLESAYSMNAEAEEALCCSGHEHREVGQLYDNLRALVGRGLLQGRGDLKRPAGPRYTECAITAAGREALASIAEHET